MRDITHIAIHHSVSPLSTTAADIEAWHTLPKKDGGKNGWKTIGYNFVVEGDGRLVLGRPLHRIPAQARGNNIHTIGICMVGDNTTISQRWVWQQVDALKGLLGFLELLFPGAIVLGHRDFPAATLCPGLDVRELLGLSPLVIT